MSDKKSTFMSKIGTVEKLFQFKINNDDDSVECSAERFAECKKEAGGVLDQARALFNIRKPADDQTVDDTKFNTIFDLVKEVKGRAHPVQLYAAMAGRDLVSTKNFLPSLGDVSLVKKVEEWVDSNILNCIGKTVREMEQMTRDLKAYDQKQKMKTVYIVDMQGYDPKSTMVLPEMEQKTVASHWQKYIERDTWKPFMGFLTEQCFVIPYGGKDFVNLVLDLAINKDLNISVLSKNNDRLKYLFDSFQSFATNFQVPINVIVNGDKKKLQPAEKPNLTPHPEDNYKIVIHGIGEENPIKYCRYYNKIWKFDDNEQSEAIGEIDILHPNLVLEKHENEEGVTYFSVNERYIDILRQQKRKQGSGYLYAILDSNKDFFPKLYSGRR